MAPQFESDDVIRDKVEHSVFAGSTNEGLSQLFKNKMYMYLFIYFS